MGFLSSLFGKSDNAVAEAATAAPSAAVSPIASMIDDVKHIIELTEGELQDAQIQLAAASDATIKGSMQLLVSRKTQAVADLHEKLAALEKKS